LIKEQLRSLLKKLGIRISASGGYHRFNAIEDILEHLQRIGFRPNLVIDGGANVGDWATMARRYFPGAEFHLVDPQPSVLVALQNVAATLPRMQVHPVALVQPGVEQVTLWGSGTGATVAATLTGERAVSVRAATLDSLFSEAAANRPPVFLKLDLEGHEIPALEGGRGLLAHCDFVLLEASFYNVEDYGLPTFMELAAWMQRAGFDLYDIAALAGRQTDGRLRSGDVLFHRRDLPLLRDHRWE